MVAEVGQTTPEPQHSRGIGIPGVVADMVSPCTEPKHLAREVVAEVVTPRTEPKHPAGRMVADAARRIDGELFWPGAPFCMVDWV